MIARLYRIVIPDGRAYIGVTKNSPARRFSDHCRAQTLVGEAIRQAGRKNVRF